MASIADLWKALGSISKLRFDANTESQTGWNGHGTGVVNVRAPDPMILVFEEVGTWRAEGGSELTFRNTFRWTNLGESLRLEHLRFGPTNPVHLFDMEPTSDGTWREHAGHVCREDCYTATLSLQRGHLSLAWRINGSKKNESIQYTYS